MATKGNAQLVAFNRGLISPLALARVDVERVALSAEEQTNWVPRVLGAMALRPGLEYTGGITGDAYAAVIPFVYSVSDTALLELTAGTMRVRVNDTLVSRVAVSSQTVNGTFDANLNDWTDADDVGGGVSSWATGGYMSLLGDGTNAAARTQQVSVALADKNKEHALRVSVYQGECYIRVGSTAGGDEYVSETLLLPGLHSLAFTPTGDFHIKVFSRESYPVLIDSIAVESAGVLSLATSWTSNTHLDTLEYHQSGDVIFVACSGVAQKRIERRSATSWSVVDYLTYDGPFRPGNITKTTITASALTGSVTLTASQPIFKSTHVGALFKVVSEGQNVIDSFGAVDDVSDPIRVTGIGTDRAFFLVISGSWTAPMTLTLQRSIGVLGAWTDISSYTTNQTVSYNDGLDNQVIYYRVKLTAFTAGADVAVRLSYASGSITGIARVTAYTSPTVVTASALKAFGSLDATTEWAEGLWSAYRGYPSAVAIYESRLWWLSKDKFNGSVTDNYVSFDEDFEGDAGPISRSIGAGPVESVRWVRPALRLVCGAHGSDFAGRSSSLDEPVTPSNFNIRNITSRGSAAVRAVMMDNNVIHVDRSGSRVFELSPDSYTNYASAELSTLIPSIGEPGITRMAIQRLPDTRIHCVRSDGKVALLVYDVNEDVKCWVILETDGFIEDVAVLPGTTEDFVYYVVRRTINGNTVRYLEKMAKTSECVGGFVNKQADAFFYYSGAATVDITGLSHLEGETVVCWADGKDRGTFVVAAGAITLPVAVTSAVVGLTYRARFKGTKLATVFEGGTALTQPKKVDHLGMILADTHARGLKYGPDYTYMDDLPLIEDGTEVDADYIWGHYDKDAVEFNGEYSTDARICLEANAPRPCTVLALVVSISTSGKL